MTTPAIRGQQRRGGRKRAGPMRGGARAQRHEHDAESEHECERAAEQAVGDGHGPVGRELAQRGAGQEAQVGRHQGQDARRQKRDQAGAEARNKPDIDVHRRASGTYSICIIFIVGSFADKGNAAAHASCRLTWIALLVAGLLVCLRRRMRSSSSCSGARDVPGARRGIARSARSMPRPRSGDALRFDSSISTATPA